MRARDLPYSHRFYGNIIVLEKVSFNFVVFKLSFERVHSFSRNAKIFEKPMFFTSDTQTLYQVVRKLFLGAFVLNE